MFTRLGRCGWGRWATPVPLSTCTAAYMASNGYVLHRIAKNTSVLTSHVEPNNNENVTRGRLDHAEHPAGEHEPHVHHDRRAKCRMAAVRLTLLLKWRNAKCNCGCSFAHHCFENSSGNHPRQRA